MEIADLLRGRAGATARSAAAKRKNADQKSLISLKNEDILKYRNIAKFLDEMETEAKELSTPPKNKTHYRKLKNAIKNKNISRTVILEALESALMIYHYKSNPSKEDQEQNLNCVNKESSSTMNQEQNDVSVDILAETETIIEEDAINELKTELNQPSEYEKKHDFDSEEYKRRCNQCILINFLSHGYDDELNPKKEVHTATADKDRVIERDLSDLRNTMMEQAVPYPVLNLIPFTQFINTMKSSTRCDCERCQGNLQSIIENAMILAKAVDASDRDFDPNLLDLSVNTEEMEHQSNLPLKKRKLF